MCVLYLMFAELPADPLLSKGEVRRPASSCCPAGTERALQVRDLFFNLRPLQVAAALTTLCVGHSLVSDITGWPLDWTAGLMRPVCVLA